MFLVNRKSRNTLCLLRKVHYLIEAFSRDRSTTFLIEFQWKVNILHPFKSHVMCRFGFEEFG